MSLTNFDINLGFNGEPTTASASFVYKKKQCSNPQILGDMGNLGEAINTGITEIDNIIGDFIVFQKTIKKDGGFRRLSYEMVDKQAKRLESIAVLVRGITAPAIGSNLNDFRRIYSAAETDIVLNFPKPNEYGLTSVAEVNNIFVIGRTFSVVTGSFGEEFGTKFYAGGKIVGQSPMGDYSAALNNVIENNRGNATLKYGYYLSDLKKLIELAGYEVSGYPEDTGVKDERPFILMDFGGSLKSVISSLAGMFGLFWYVRGNKIRFFNNEDLKSLSVPNFTEKTDSNILSSSYSKDLCGKSSVGVIYGSSKPKGSFSFPIPDVPRPVEFFYLDIPKLFGGKKLRHLLSNFVTFFKFSGDADTFDKILFVMMVNDHIATQGEPFDTLYGNRRPPKQLVKLKTLATTFNKNVLRKEYTYLKNHEAIYSLMIDGVAAERPSEKKIYKSLKTAAQAYGSLYISKPFSKFFSKNYILAANEGFSVHGPYLGSTLVKDITELEGINFILSGFIEGGAADDITIRQLHELSEPKDPQAIPTKKSTSIFNGNNSYHYVAIKDLFADAEKFDKQINIRANFSVKEMKEKVETATKDISGKYFTIDGQSFVSSGPSEWTNIKSMAKNSQDFVEALGTIQKSVRMFASKVKETPEGDDIEEYESENVSFRIRDGSEELSSVDVIRFEGTNDEAAHIDSNFDRLFSPSFKPESSSVTYSGFVEADMNDPALSSVSYTLSENGVDTSLSFSNREFAAEDESVIMATFSSNSSNRFARGLKTRQKNFLGVN